MQALDYGALSGGFEPGLTAGVVTYQLRQFGFHCGGKGVSFWVGSCAPGEPDAWPVFRALRKPELLERVETLEMPDCG